MRAFGPGSVSSFLKIILDVVFAALWVLIVVLGLVTLAALLLSFNPSLLADLRNDAARAIPDSAIPDSAVTRMLQDGPSITLGLAAAVLYLSGIQLIVASLRRIFMTLTAGDPFLPDNIARLRLIGLALAGLELGRYAFWAVSTWLLPSASKVEPNLSVTAWFSVLVVFVLAEVFREGARLRREAELTI